MSEVMVEKNGNIGIEADNPTTAKLVIDNGLGNAIDVSGGRIIRVQDPSNPQEAATKNYVDSQVAGEGADVPTIMFNHLTSQDNSISIDLNTITKITNLESAVNVGNKFHAYLTGQETSIGISLDTITVTSPTLTSQISSMTDQQAAKLLTSVNADLNTLCTTVNRLERLINSL
jgi:hypothetical protein